ncbi:MAG: RHS repeat-associated core domain-containing protein, partial [Anaerolineales bacterium]
GGGWAGEQRYKAWGEVRYSAGVMPTKYTYTGQYSYTEGFGLMFYNARWYDPSLGRFAQGDKDVPQSQGSSGNAVGYIWTFTYSPLVVDYHENQSLKQLNTESKTGLQNSGYTLPLFSTNPNAFDRYAYLLNNPIRYVDPSGHFPILATLGLITPLGWAAIGVTAIGVSLYFAVPGVQEAVTNGVYEAGEATSNGLNALFAKGEYIPPGLSDAERVAYREAVHIYKDAYGIPANEDVPKNILDAIAELIKKGVKPIDAADSVDEPPEADLDVE